MDPNFRGDDDHHDGTSDATPGGYSKQRRPGEVFFTCFLLVASAVLLNEAFGISGFGQLSAPGTVPVVTAAIMVLCMAIIFFQTIRLPKVTGESIARDILPWRVLAFVGFLIAYALAVRPLGFLPTTALFLVLGIRILGRGWLFSVGVGLGALVGIWIVFRIVFTVLMPPGIVPEAELVQIIRNLFSGVR
ncbi:tripartite tricarboxylate transporter TctB family protein [Roseinatronobacter sp.]|uniref:tripartite tricarboxylate transporter TctB family protein n=1 Tax=Roseinatronobacter sp. TaxID=1945755 RepID=UPI003F70F695